MQGFPFDSQITFDESGQPNYDRAVSSQPLRKLIKELFTNGVMPNPSTNLQVEEGEDGMTVIVNPGFAVIEGGLCKEDNSRTLTVTAADPTYDRIDTVVVRWNENIDVRTADLYIVQGIASVSPVRPALTRTESVYEIGLADVFVTHGVATITDEKITDTRMETARCGIVSSVSEWDTTTIYQQIQAELASFQSNEEAEFLTWFEHMKDQLSEDAAGHLQEEIDDINEINTFNVATTDWVANTNSSTNEDYPYVAVKASDKFTNDSRPIWQMEGVNGIATGDEKEAKNLVEVADFSTTGVKLYATDEVTVALVLVTKGV